MKKAPPGYRLEERPLPSGESLLMPVPDEERAGLIREFVRSWARTGDGGGYGPALERLLGVSPAEAVLLQPFLGGVTVVRNPRNCFVDLDELWEHTELVYGPGGHEALVPRSLWLQAFARLAAGADLVGHVAQRGVCDLCRGRVAERRADCSHLEGEDELLELAAVVMGTVVGYFHGSTPGERLRANWPGAGPAVASAATLSLGRLQARQVSGADLPDAEARVRILSSLATPAASPGDQGEEAWSVAELGSMARTWLHAVRVSCGPGRTRVTVETNLLG